ncbi:MAG: FecR family protein [Reinekea sp.]
MKIATWHLFIAALFIGLTTSAWANIGKIIIAKGETYAIDAGNNYRLLQRRSDVLEGDTLVTGKDSELHIRFNDNAILALRANSQLKINDYSGGPDPQAQDKVFMKLLTGGFRTITGSFGKSNRDAYQIKTPNASIGVRGTNYEAVLSDSSLLVGVYHGGIWVQNNTGEIFLGLDSSFSFAQVNSVNDVVKGLVEAPEELSKPLSTSLSPAAAESTTPLSDEESAKLTEEDDSLLVENLFEPTTTAPEVNQAAGTPETIQTLLINSISSDVQETITTLADEVDMRLTSKQIAALTAGTDVGFVIVNDDPRGYRIANYELAEFNGIDKIDSNNIVTFDISLAHQTFTITLDSSYTDPNMLAADINSQIKAQMGFVGPASNQMQIAPAIDVTAVMNGGAAHLVFKGFVDEPDQAIVIDNFTGGLPEFLATVYGLGLCDGTTISCTASFSAGENTQGDYPSATHFGYFVPGENGPVFVNYNNESITALNFGYIEPDNVFHGNGTATLTYFNSANSMTNGENQIEWGYWESNASNPAILYQNAKNQSDFEEIDTPFFFVSAPPIEKADLVGAMRLTTVVDWHATSSNINSVLGAGSGTADLTATLAVDFSTAQATGSLALQNSVEDWGWDMQYSGKIKNAQFFSDYGWGSYSTSSTTLDAVGHVDGMFTPAQDSIGNPTIGFVGGFGLQTTDDSQWAQGVFVLK